MKKVSTHLSVFLFFSVFLVSQNNYSLLPEQNAVWIYYYWKYASAVPSDTSDIGYSCIKTDTDTIINSKTYHKLIVYPWCEIGNIKSYIGAFRNDYGTQKTYIVLPNTSSEKLLIDFNIQYADSIKSKSMFSYCGLNYGTWACNPYFMNAVFNNIDSVQFLDGQWHKRYRMNLENPCADDKLQIIDGIGYTAPFTVGDQYRRPCQLHCFFWNNSLQYEITPSYPIKPCNELSYLLNVMSFLNINNAISIYPNPSQGDYLYINGTDVDSAQAINMLGIKTNLILKNGVININNLPHGLYIIQITDINRHNYFFKWLKQ